MNADRPSRRPRRRFGDEEDGSARGRGEQQEQWGDRRKPEDMTEQAWQELPDHGTGSAPNRFDIDGFRTRLFGGPSASLYGDSGVPARKK